MSNSASALRNEAVAQIGARLDRLPITRYQLWLLTIIAFAWVFDSIDLGALTFLLGSIKKEFQLSTAQAGLLASMSFIGMLFGAIFSGIAADRFGRKSLFQVSMVFWGAGSLLCAFAPNLTTLFWARVLTGFGMGMEYPVAQAIASEISPPQHRGRVLAILEGCWPIGFLLAGLLALVMLQQYGWRPIFVIEGLPAFFMFVIRRNLPESPRWLADNGEFTEAEKVLVGIEEHVRRNLRGGELPPVVAKEGQAPDQRWLLTIFEILSPRYIKRTVMLWLVWFFAMLGYYGLTTWLATLLQLRGFAITQSIKYTLEISSGGLLGAAVAACLIEWLGRRWLCSTLLLTGALFCFLYGTADSSHLLVYGFFMQFCLFGMWSVLYAYTPELYPTRARATGAGLASAIGRIGSLSGPYIAGAIILPRFGQVGIFACGAFAFVIAAITMLILGDDKTTGSTLEEASP